MELPLSESFEILERLSGHIPLIGKSSGQELNRAYRLRDISSNELCIGMFCKPNHITLIDISTWDRIQTDSLKYSTWYYAPVGYISRTRKVNDTIPYSYLHHFVMNYAHYGKGKNSIDHINQNKLDNRITNLRITTQSIQNSNRGKVSRHKTAIPLPKEIEGPLPKFCVYYKECYNKQKNYWRDFFVVEGHPSQNGLRKATTKSGKVSIQDKLKEAHTILRDLDKINKENNLLHGLENSGLII